MDFSTAMAPPVAIRINGTSYRLPRFLIPQMKQWAAERAQIVADRATAHLDADAKARFLMYFQPPPVDVFELAKYARSAEGAGEIVDRQMKLADVPDEVRAAVVANADPIMIATLADQLASSNNAAAGAAASTEENATGSDPLAGQSAAPASPTLGESPDSPGVGQTNSPSSTASTTDSTKIA